MAYDNDNIFAKILRGEISAVKVYEDDTSLAFMDVMPQSPGHTLVIPKTPAENLYDLPVLIDITQVPFLRKTHFYGVGPYKGKFG